MLVTCILLALSITLFTIKIQNVSSQRTVPPHSSTSLSREEAEILVKERRLLGISRDEIERLLGTPSYSESEYMRYYIETELSPLFGPNSYFLVVETKNQVVTGAYVSDD